MLPIELSELWDSYRSTTVAADASAHDLELAWSTFHGGVFALARVLAHMDANGKGDAALRVVRWISAELSAAQASAPGPQ
jgi:hypothetical protein